MRLRLRLASCAPVIAIAFIAGDTVVPAWLLSGFVAERMLQQEARRTQEFVNSILVVEQTGDLLRGERERAVKANETFAHLVQMPSVLRANMYSTDRKIVWSTEPFLIGQHMLRNAELEQALHGQLVAYSGKRAKPEHRYLGARHYDFVEIYAPIRNEATGEVLGVVELYTMPAGLSDDIRASQQWLWAAALLSALALGAAALKLRARAAPRSP